MDEQEEPSLPPDPVGGLRLLCRYRSPAEKGVLFDVWCCSKDSRSARRLERGVEEVVTEEKDEEETEEAEDSCTMRGAGAGGGKSVMSLAPLRTKAFVELDGW